MIKGDLKVFLCLLMVSSMAFAAEATKENYITKELTYGLEARTGYDSNIYGGASDQESSFVIRVSPFIKFEKEWAVGPLSIDYRPEYSWYENKPSSQNNTWNHNLITSFSWNMTPTITWDFNDNFSIEEGSNVANIGGVTTGGGNNDYTRNVFDTKVTWEFTGSQELSIGYNNLYQHFDDSTNDFRNVKENEVSFGYAYAINSAFKLGTELEVGRSNFYDSATNIGGVNTTRDTQWERFLITLNSTVGSLIFDLEVGAEHREVIDATLSHVDEDILSPYLDAKIILRTGDSTSFVVNYKHSTQAGSRDDLYWAMQDAAGFSANHKFSDRLDLTCFASYESNEYMDKYARESTATVGREDWISCGVTLTYVLKQNLDAVFGVENRRLSNALADEDKYTTNSFDVGLIYKF